MRPAPPSRIFCTTALSSSKVGTISSSKAGTSSKASSLLLRGATTKAMYSRTMVGVMPGATRVSPLRHISSRSAMEPHRRPSSSIMAMGRPHSFLGTGTSSHQQGPCRSLLRASRRRPRHCPPRLPATKVIPPSRTQPNAPPALPISGYAAAQGVALRGRGSCCCAPATALAHITGAPEGVRTPS